MNGLEFCSTICIARLDLKEVKVPDGSKVNTFVKSVSPEFFNLANKSLDLLTHLSNLILFHDLHGYFHNVIHIRGNNEDEVVTLYGHLTQLFKLSMLLSLLGKNA